MSTPRLKTLVCASRDDRLAVSIDPRCLVELADPDGRVRHLLELLSEGGRSPDALAAELGVSEDEVSAAIASLDELGWLKDAEAETVLDSEVRERHYSNLAFLDGFSTLARTSVSMQEKVFAAHVAVLGVGGLGSGVVQHLAGLGVGRLTLLDFDQVDSRNFARQFTYTPAQLGLSKVEQVAAWVAAFAPGTVVRALHQRVTGPDVVAALLPGVDLVVAAVDTPVEVDMWVNQACVAAGVPHIRGGLSYLQGFYWSVDPGRSACHQCLETSRDRQVEREGPAAVSTWPRVLEPDPVNRANGPIAGMLAGLVGMEALRYLTGFVPPVSAGTYQLIDFSGACQTSAEAWPRDPGCRICATAPERAP
jgi:molybdopterin/thiamine biosynthesis adenylyltransferase